MNRYAPALAFSLLTLVGCIILREWFGPILWQANSTPFNLGGDGLKNYFTVAAYIQFGHGFHFPTFFYPYGEHVVFTDAQPLVAWLLKGFDVLGFPVVENTVGILNWLMISSILIGWWLVFAIARRKGLPPFWAAAAALLIGGLSPQIARMPGGHYALAYVFFVPLIWWLLLWSDGPEKQILKRAILFVTVFAFAFVHPYYLLMGCAFTGVYLGARALSRAHRTNWKAWAQAGLFLLGPMILFQLIMKLSDPFSDRPSMPYGYFLTRASWHSVFMPWTHPWPEIWRNGLFGKPQYPDFEGIAYVGWVVAIGFFAMALRFVLLTWRTRRLRWNTDTHTAVAAVLLLMVAFTWPLVWFYDEPPTWLGPLRQFRALGRFAWPFYYVASMYTALLVYGLFRLLRQRNLPALAWGLVLGAGMVWYAQMAFHGSHQLRPLRTLEGNNQLIWKSLDFKALLEKNGYKTTDFQAVIPVPAFFVGTEKFIDGYNQENLQKYAYRVNLDTGLPLINGNASRSSIGNVVKLRQIYANAAINRPVLADMRPDKSFLLFADTLASISVSERRLLSLGKRIVNVGPYVLFELTPADLCERPQDLLAWVDARKDSVKEAGQGLFSTDTLAKVYFNGFGDGWKNFREKTAKADPKTHVLQLYSDTLPFGGPLHMSFWLRIDPAQHGFPVLYWAAYNDKGAVLAQTELATRFQFETMDDWLRMEAGMAIPDSATRLAVWLQGRDAEADNFLIQRQGFSVIAREGDDVFIDNYFLNRKHECVLKNE